jgi:hypothetical protein
LETVAVAPGANFTLNERCPTGEVVLGGTFDQTPPSTVTTTSALSAVDIWRYTLSNSPSASATAVLSMHTYCAAG